MLFSNQMSETRHGFCTAGLGTRGKGGYHLMAVLGYRLQSPSVLVSVAPLYRKVTI